MGACMKKKLLFIYNPHAGKGMIRSKLSDIIEIFVKADYEVTIYSTKGRHDATNITKERAMHFDLIACSGGDGTLNEVTVGLMHCKTRPPCGYIPAGTTNDVANSLKIPKNMKKAAEMIVDGKQFPFDIGTINEDYFIYVAGFGAFTDVSYGTPQSSKNILGRVAYLLEGAKRLPTLKSYRFTVYYEDQVIEDDFIFGMITNSNSIGGFKGLSGKNVKLDDGLFEVSLIKMPKNPMDLQLIINSLIIGEPNSKYFYTFPTSELKLVSDEMVPWTIDGEFGGNLKEVHIKNHMHAITFIN